MLPDTESESVMKVRIRFSKTGALVYIGHLDVMRYFQKLFVRSGLPVAYSEGFSPHQLLSFTPPLPLGMESTGEYADVVLTKSITTKEAIMHLRKQSVDGIYISSFRALPEKCENAMAAVKAASYSVKFCKKPSEDISMLISGLQSKEEMMVTKKSKKSERMINIRPLIHELTYEDDTVNMMISSGSIDNIKPELVINALFEASQKSYTSQDLLIKRIDQYTLIEDKLISLDLIGSNIDG